MPERAKGLHEKIPMARKGDLMEEERAEEKTGEKPEERRSVERFDLSQVGVWVKNAAYEDDPKIPFRPGGTLIDFSSTGLGILTKEGLKKDDQVIIRIKYGNKQSHAKGRVVRRARSSGRDCEVGIELDESDREFLPKLIVSYFRSQEKQQPYGLFTVIGIAGAIVGFVLGWLLL